MKQEYYFKQKTGYEFKDISLFLSAITHTSYANEHKHLERQDNERLEFLGDSILELVISEYLFKNLKSLSEGKLTKIRATIVCEESLRKSADQILLGDLLLLGKGEEITGGRFRSSILADAFEAIIGAIYLDGGMESAKNFILNQMERKIKAAIHGDVFLDHKTRLQEILQKEGKVDIEYKVIKEEGPDHRKTFTIQLLVNQKPLAIGIGFTKKDAEQMAAKELLCKKQ